MELYSNQDCWELVLRLRSEMLAIESHKKKMEKVLLELPNALENRWNKYNKYINGIIEGQKQYYFRNLNTFIEMLPDTPIEDLENEAARLRDEGISFTERNMRYSYEKYEHYELMKTRFGLSLWESSIRMIVNRSNLHRNM